MTHHLPVLLQEVLALAPNARRVVDGTLGDGGHAGYFLAAGAKVLGVDRDPEAVVRARERLDLSHLQTIVGSIYAPDVITAAADFSPDLILLDLGVSSRQLDDAALGFTFRPDAPLDMRMSQTGPTAADLLNEAPEADLARWFRDYGDERRAFRLARTIVRRRARSRFEKSDDLVNAIREVAGPRSGPADFARLFQAVRIAVNEELEGLDRALPGLRDALVDGGTLAAISYHSGEDRIVKHSFREWSRACVCPREMPVCRCRGRPLGERVTRRAIVPTPEEITGNPRARSARLRAFRVQRGDGPSA